MRPFLIGALFLISQTSSAVSVFNPQLPSIETTNECTSQIAPSIYEMRQYIQLKFGNRKKTPLHLTGERAKDIHITYEDPELLEIFYTLVKDNTTYLNASYNREIIKNNLGHSDFDALSESIISCTDIICTLNVLYGEDYATFALYMMSKYKVLVFNNSGVQASLTKWTPYSWEPLLKAFQTLPEAFHKDLQLTHYFDGRIKAILHSEPSINGMETLADALMDFYPSWLNWLNDSERVATVLHELGHNFDFAVDSNDNLIAHNLSEKQQWLNYSEWKKNPKGDWSAERTQSIPDDDHYRSSPYEDFAQSVALYLLQPELLQSISMEKYQFIKSNVFHEQEFTSFDKCSGIQITDIQSYTREWLAQLPNTFFALDTLTLSCTQHLGFGPTISPEFKQCISNQALDQLLHQRDSLALLYSISEQHQNVHPDLVREKMNLIAHSILRPTIEKQVNEHLFDFSNKINPLLTKTGIQNLAQIYISKIASTDFIAPNSTSELNDNLLGRCSLKIDPVTGKLSDSSRQCLAKYYICSQTNYSADSSYLERELSRDLTTEQLKIVKPVAQDVFWAETNRECLRHYSNSQSSQRFEAFIESEWKNENKKLQSLSLNLLNQANHGYYLAEFRKENSAHFLQNHFKADSNTAGRLKSYIENHIYALTEGPSEIYESSLRKNYPTGIWDKEISRTAVEHALNDLEKRIREKELDLLAQQWRGDLRQEIGTKYFNFISRKITQNTKTNIYNSDSNNKKLVYCENLTQEMSFFNKLNEREARSLSKEILEACLKLQNDHRSVSQLKEKDFARILREVGLFE